MTRKAPRAAMLLTGIALAVTTSFAIADELDNANEKALAIKLAPETAHRLAIQWCSSCHGPGGRSVNPIFPHIAGQPAEYLVNQLKSFHNLNQDFKSATHEGYVEQWILNITGWRKPYTSYFHSNNPDYKYDNAPRNEERAWDFMKGVARDLDEPTMQALADFFSKQTPAPGVVGAEAKGGNIEHGKVLYSEGDASKGLLACQMCHGPDAKGQGPIPRLAGQHADYVKLQLQFIQSGVRNVEQMQALIANLTDADLQDVAAYVQSLE
ncbi:MAG TPA: c-type cytochrome [Burkholderiaceae bacterium]|nr:c-type cytochrome [Burkholderiaceae bacterium]